VTDKPTDDPGDDEGPITPEVVGSRRGAAARKRPRPGDAAATTEPVADERPAGRSIFRIGCIALAALGLLLAIQGGIQAADPEATQCLNARGALLNDADDRLDDEELDERTDEIDDLDCDEVFTQAAELEDYEPPTDNAVRTLGGITIAIGVVQVVSGLMTARSRSRGWRIAALAAAAPIVVLAFLTGNILLLLLSGFVVYALAFSRDAKSIFGSGPGFLRPSAPPPA
jgi:hypothetical protein